MVVKLGKLLDITYLEVCLVDIVLVNGNRPMPLKQEDIRFPHRLNYRVCKCGSARATIWSDRNACLRAIEIHELVDDSRNGLLEDGKRSCILGMSVRNCLHVRARLINLKMHQRLRSRAKASLIFNHICVEIHDDHIGHNQVLAVHTRGSNNYKASLLITSGKVTRLMLTHSFALSLLCNVHDFKLEFFEHNALLFYDCSR